MPQFYNSVYNIRWSLLLKHFLGVSSLTNFVTANVTRDYDPCSAPTDQFTRRDNLRWPYAAIGDSLRSGVAYNQDALYNNNLDDCLRMKDFHGPQMEADTTWTGSFSSGLRDAACSGSRLVDLARVIVRWERWGSRYCYTGVRVRVTRHSRGTWSKLMS